MPEHSAWALEGTLGNLCLGTLSGRVDVSRPDWGIRHVGCGGNNLPRELLAVHRYADTEAGEPAWPLPVKDAYVRGKDLVAAYQPTDGWPYSPQIYWRANALGDMPQALASLSLLVSVQTDLLDTCPQLSVTSLVVPDELIHIAVSDREHAAQTLSGKNNHTLRPEAGIRCLVVRLPGGQTSYAECVPASDFQQLAVSPADDNTNVAKLQWQLFNEFLEKGVIRRARVHTFFLPRENDIELAVACCRGLATRPLPLTT